MKSHIKSSASRKVFQTFNYLFLLLITFICIYPFWYVVIYTFSEPSKIGTAPPVFLPSGFSIENYRQILTLKGFFSGSFGLCGKDCGGYCFNSRKLLIFRVSFF